MLYYIYARKSVVTKRGESIQNQIEWAEKYIENNFREDTDKKIKIYKDEGFSGKNLERPDFQQMYSDLEIEKPQYILCYRLDRISRSVNDFSNLIEDLGKKQIGFICQQGNLNTKDYMGKALLLLSSVFAQLERETIAERVRDNMMALAEKGRWLGGTPPTGFTSEKVESIIVEGKSKTSCKLKPLENELNAVKIIYDIYFQKRSISAVSKYLMSKNIVSRTDKFFSNLGIKEILRNPVYCVADREAYDYFMSVDANVCVEEEQLDGIHGLLAYNKRNYMGDTASRNPITDWIISVGQHKGIIIGEKWVEIQKSLDQNKSSGIAPKAHNDYSLLSGMIRCKNCGSRMFASRRHSKNANSELFDYICNSKLRGGSALCSIQNLNGIKTDEFVCDYLKGYLKVDKSIIQLLEENKEKLKKSDKSEDIVKIDHSILSNQKKIDNLIAFLTKDGVSEATFQSINKQVSELSNNIAELKKQKAEYEEEIQAYHDEDFNIEVIVSALAYFKECFNDLTIHDKRLIIQAVVEKIVWDGENLNIFIYGE